MRRIEQTGRFRRDYKREARTDPQLDQDLQPVLQALASGSALPERLRDHALSGEWKDFRDCHVRPDLVLIYALVGEDVLSLSRLGSHSEIFG